MSEGNASKTFITQIRLLCQEISSQCSLWKVIPYDEIRFVDWNLIPDEKLFDTFLLRGKHRISQVRFFRKILSCGDQDIQVRSFYLDRKGL